VEAPLGPEGDGAIAGGGAGKSLGISTPRSAFLSFAAMPAAARLTELEI
jgi:hypothetical protein